MQTCSLQHSRRRLAYGMVLFVISIGLSVTMGLMRVVNLAHGAFAMIGGYIASYAARDLGLGYAVRSSCRRRHGRHRHPDRAFALPPDLWRTGADTGADDHRHHLLRYRHRQLCLWPDAEDHSACRPRCRAGRSRLPHDSRHRLFAILCGLAVAGGSGIAIEKTSFGVKLRASVDNAAMAAALGVRTEVIYAVSFAVAVGLAASAAWWAPSCCRSSPITRCATW
jgi:branched-chain amino acid transport system permease protein